MTRRPRETIEIPEGIKVSNVIAYRSGTKRQLDELHDSASRSLAAMQAHGMGSDQEQALIRRRAEISQALIEAETSDGSVNVAIGLAATLLAFVQEVFEQAQPVGATEKADLARMIELIDSASARAELIAILSPGHVASD